MYVQMCNRVVGVTAGVDHQSIARVGNTLTARNHSSRTQHGADLGVRSTSDLDILLSEC